MFQFQVPFFAQVGARYVAKDLSIYEIRVVEGGFVLVQDITKITPYGDHPRIWISIGTLSTLEKV
jgi:hypothetical protein